MNGISPNEPGKKVYNNILECIGNTPLVRLNRVPVLNGLECEMYAKCEFMNPGGSIKDRIAYTMVKDAEKKGKAIPKTTRFVEPTSGNTGIGVCLAAAINDYKCTIVTPDKNSEEKMNTMRLLGGEIIQTPSNVPHDDPESYMEVAKRIVRADPKAMSLDQYDNRMNPDTHFHHTAVEILESLDTVDMFVMGMGTGGTVTGAGLMLKNRFPNCIIVGVDPKGSILWYQKAKPHPYFVEGIGGDFRPAVLDTHAVSKVIQPDDKDSFIMSRQMIREEGLLCGGSSGAITWAAIRAAKDCNLGKGKKVVVILPDSIRNYMTKFVSDQWMEAHLFKELPERNFPWWKRCIRNLKINTSVPTITEDTTCAEALEVMGSDNIAFVTDKSKHKLLKGVVTKDSFRSEATTPKKDGRFNFNDPVSKHLMKNLYKVIENKHPSPTVGLASRILDITPFVVVAEEYGKDDKDNPTFIGKGIITPDIVLKYIVDPEHNI